MYVSYLLEKEATMYPGSARSNNPNFPAQNFPSTAPYPEYMGYQNLLSMENHGQPAGGWGSHYGLPREEWNAYGAGTSCSVVPSPMNGSSAGQLHYGAVDYNPPNPTACGALPLGDTINTEQISSHNQRHSSCQWMRKNMSSNSAGKTRTKEKYRVVYTDQQRLELEKEFQCNSYITIRRKSELAANLGLSERQVKIWFQNRRAKERKMIKKKISQFDGSGGSVQSDSGSVSPSEMSTSLFVPPHTMNGLLPIEIQQVIVAE